MSEAQRRASRRGDATAAPHPAGFDYELPPERIAQEPAAERDAARLLVVRRGASDAPLDARVRDLPRLLRRGDLLVVNRSRVFPARLRGRRLPGGGAVEILLVSRSAAGADGERWRVLARPGRRLREGQAVAIERATGAAAPAEGAAHGAPVTARVAASGEGWVELRFPPGVDVHRLAEGLGETPLPPYIRRPGGATAEDARRYQTVYAAESGSIAAPTAGLHLTQRLFDELRAAGVGVAEVVLHVGPATFLAGQPGREALAVEPERYQIPAPTRDAIAATRGGGRGRVVAVGTTTVRALETAARAGWAEGPAETSLVLAPGDRFAVVDALLTNFHLPGSSLLALVSAFAGVETARLAYAAALEGGYRFYSYGDAMLVV